MPPPYCYDYPHPAVTVDLVVFGLLGDALRVLFIRRKHEPYAGRWALPGGFLEIDEPIEEAARRELREETGYDATGPVELIGVFGKPGRDPRGRTISLVHATTLRGPLPEVAGGDDAAEAAWLDPRAPLELSFDHAEILAAALRWLERGIEEGSLGLALLGEEFSAAEINALFRALGKPARSANSWRTQMVRRKRVEPNPDGSGWFHAAPG
jgi:8-oxo-dGTP diphosphatase